MKLKNRIALVTGAARGIGLAIAECFVAEGATVVIADVLDAEGEKTSKTCGAYYLHCDVSKSADIQATVDHIVKTPWCAGYSGEQCCHFHRQGFSRDH